MQWISVNDKLPHDVWIEEMTSKNPNGDWVESIDQVCFDCLVVFADVNDGHVSDSEVVSVLYTRRDGWLRRNWKPFTGGSLLAITHWMFMPDPVSDKEAQEVYNENCKIGE
jgi:hypothetical protein